MFSMMLAVILVYLVMAAQFESFKYPMLIMFSLPLSVDLAAKPASRLGRGPGRLVSAPLTCPSPRYL